MRDNSDNRDGFNYAVCQPPVSRLHQYISLISTYPKRVVRLSNEAEYSRQNERVLKEEVELACSKFIHCIFDCTKDV